MGEPLKDEMTPKDIVCALDKHIIGQDDAKRVAAIALRNRARRRAITGEIMNEIHPCNILMVGPTGVGKTEIARRLANIAKAPFIKVEATKFTEIGYVGRDVDSIIRDLAHNAFTLLRTKKHEEVREMAQKNAMNKIVEIMVGKEANPETKAKFVEKVRSGKLDDVEIEVMLSENSQADPSVPMMDMPGMQVGVVNVMDLISKTVGGNKERKCRLPIAQALEALIRDESDKLVNEDEIKNDTVKLTENSGIVFIDEIDKIISTSNDSRNDVNRHGVQRDLLPLIEGTAVPTKYGVVNTDHILFIASGAFHHAKPSDLLPELQGRLHTRVELLPLTQKDFVRILKEPEHNLIRQYKALFSVESVKLEFEDKALEKIAEIATELNKEVENIGARRLHAVLEKLLESASFTISETPGITIKVDSNYVDKNLINLEKSIKDRLNRYII